MDDLALFDVPAMIGHIQKQTGFGKKIFPKLDVKFTLFAYKIRRKMTQRRELSAQLKVEKVKFKLVHKTFHSESVVYSKKLRIRQPPNRFHKLAYLWHPCSSFSFHSAFLIHHPTTRTHTHTHRSNCIRGLLSRYQTNVHLACHSACNGEGRRPSDHDRTGHSYQTQPISAACVCPKLGSVAGGGQTSIVSHL